MPLSVLIVDDHRILREGVRNLLQQDGDFDVVAEAGSVEEAVQLAGSHQPDIVLLDLHLGEVDGLSAIIPIRLRSPLSRVLVLSMDDDEQVVRKSLQMGARGFVLKKASSGDLLLALKAVAAGGIYLSPEVSDAVVQRVPPAGSRRRPVLEGLESLSPRELEVMELVVDGKTSKDVADLLSLQVETVRTYRKSLMRKLGVKGVAGLVNLAIQHGMLRSRQP
ncbi:MAG: response regulator transcription factor [Bryobacterales bacterium]|nr:response regulator transcription factor [Bryobacterales bacterium]